MSGKSTLLVDALKSSCLRCRKCFAVDVWCRLWCCTQSKALKAINAADPSVGASSSGTQVPRLYPAYAFSIAAGTVDPVRKTAPIDAPTVAAPVAYTPKSAPGVTLQSWYARVGILAASPVVLRMYIKEAEWNPKSPIGLAELLTKADGPLHQTVKPDEKFGQRRAVDLAKEEAPAVAAGAMEVSVWHSGLALVASNTCKCGT